MAGGPMQIGFSAPNAGGFVVDVSRFATDLSDFSDAWPDVFRGIEEIEEAEFASGGGRHGGHGRWPSLSSPYALWKTEKYRGPQGDHFPQVLSLTGALHRSLSGESEHSIRVSGRTGFRFGTALEYATYHQDGTAAGGKIRRPIDPPKGSIRKPWVIIAKAIQAHAVRMHRKRLGKFAREQINQSFGSWG